MQVSFPSLFVLFFPISENFRQLLKAANILGYFIFSYIFFFFLIAVILRIIVRINKYLKLNVNIHQMFFN